MKRGALLVALKIILMVVAVGQEPETEPASEGSSIGGAEMLVVVGAGGTPEYQESFDRWAAQWKQVAEASKIALTIVGNDSADETGVEDDRARIRQWIADRDPNRSATIWIVLIGHGTFARDIANVNLRGPDLSAKQLSQWLQPIERPLVIVNSASASGPFIDRLSGPNRVIVTSTKSGNEQNYSRFGKYFADAITSTTSDLDHDDEVSVQEAFLKASEGVRRFYEAEDRIPTEHALLDDNGDQKGTPATMFRGIRPVENAKDGTELDGTRASRITLAPSGSSLPLTNQQQTHRDQIESQLDELRKRKSEMSIDDFFRAVEPLMVELATIYRDAESKNEKTDE